MTIVLDYAQAPPTTRRPLELIFLLLWLPALAIPFLDFTHGVTPLAAAGEIANGAIPLLGISFFIAFPIIIWKFRRWLAPPARWERRITLALVFVCAAPHVMEMALIARDIIHDPHWPTGGWVRVLMEWSILICGFGIPLLGLLLALSLHRRGESARALEILMMSPFVANAAMCLFAFYDDPETGYWLTIWIVMVGLGEMAILGWPRLHSLVTRAAFLLHRSAHATFPPDRAA